MFSKAYGIASQYTRPVIVLKRLENGTVAASMASFVLLNKDGWALTAAHVVLDAMVAQQHGQERAAYNQQLSAIQNNAAYSVGKKKHELNKLTKNHEWITNLSFWWANDAVGMAPTFHFNIEADLAAVQLTNSSALGITVLPQLAAPGTNITPGTSLCRLGYPFHTVNAQFDTTANQFKMDLPPMAMFPNEGIHTRIMIQLNEQTKKQTKFLETSSPGLRGQSGGPIFDTESKIWAIQSKTLSLQLGFAPTVKQGKKEIVEHQFIHIGVGAHVEEIRSFLDQFKIAYEVAK